MMYFFSFIFKPKDKEVLSASYGNMTLDLEHPIGQNNYVQSFELVRKYIEERLNATEVVILYYREV